MRRVLVHPIAPLVGCALGCLAYVIAHPATADMAAHAYRAWLFQHEGLTPWNAQWYGGHAVLGYSLLFAPLAALAGPIPIGVASALAAEALFIPLARSVARTPAMAAAASWLFAGGVLSNVFIGRMPFLLGIALGLGAWMCARRRKHVGAGVLAVASMWASPVAGVYVLLGAAALAAGGGRRAPKPALWLAIPALAGGIVMWKLFPEGGTDRFAASAFWPMLAISAGGVALLTPRRRTLWAAGLLYLAVLVGAFVVPTPFGQNALRLGVLAGPSVLALAHRRRPPVLALAVVGVGLVYLQWLPAVRAVAEAHGDPSTHAAFQDEARDFLDRVAQPGERVEVPLTLNHWEAADIAKVVPLARGWERQLDQKSNPIFYGPKDELTPASYHAWLRDNAVRWIALPHTKLDYSAKTEAKLLAGDLSYLTLVYRSPRWRIWKVRGTDPPASNGAQVLAAGPTWFEVDTRGPTVVRYRYTKYWYADDACVSRTSSGWTSIEPDRPGVVMVRARFDLERPSNPVCSR
jgi:hypothetical protein